MLAWNRLWKSFKINLIISPHHISDNCDPPLNAAMAIRIRVGVVEAYTECHDATLRNAFFLHLHKIYDIWFIIVIYQCDQTSSNSQLRHLDTGFRKSCCWRFWKLISSFLANVFRRFALGATLCNVQPYNEHKKDDLYLCRSTRGGYWSWKIQNCVGWMTRFLNCFHRILTKMLCVGCRHLK